MASATIKITYNLKPPSSVEVADKPKTKAHEFGVNASPESPAHKDFYKALRSSLEVARIQVGDELTAWRDLVGKTEIDKEVKKKGADDEEDDDEMDEEEGV